MERAGVIAEIRAACDRFAERPALVEAGRVVTYAELGARLDEAAALPRINFYVPLERPHGADAVIELLGILASGRCAVPLDPAQPDAVRAAISEQVSVAASVSEPNAAAVLFFTSGSSGTPKGIALPQRTLARAVEIFQDMIAFTAEDRHALLSPLSVSASLAQVLTPLRAGSALHFFEARRHSTAELVAWIAAKKITTLQTVPSLFRALATAAAGRRFADLRRVKLGGETVTSADAKHFAAITERGAVLVNGLGLTEAGFNVCWRTWRDGEPLADGAFPIGRPARGVEIEVEPTADGVGEIKVRSDALPGGYWHDPSRTAEVFRELPDRPGWRELWTRDAGRWDENGELVHLGRLDQLVKIRGHRVEPGAVEAAALELPGVTAVAVIVRHEGEAALLELFVEATGDGSLTLTATVVRAQLAAKLADFALPARVTVLEKFPRLAFGKVDRQALASRNGDIPVAASSGKGPGQECPGSLGALEQTLFSLFSRALRRKKVSAADSFFDLGGDSLAAATLFADIAKVLRVELPLAELKANPTVGKLAALIRAGGWNLNDNPVALLSPSPEADAVNVFMWPGAGSDVLALADFARSVGPSVAFYGIQHRGADGRRVYDTSLAAMAERGERLIRAIQPCGPWVVGGGSFGGYVALEVARRLRADGEVQLAMFDTFGPGFPKPSAGLSLSGRLNVWLRAIKPLGRGDEAGVGLVLRGLASHAVRFVARRMVRRAAPDARPLGMRLRYLFLMEACMRTLSGHAPQAYDGPVSFFRVAELLPAELFVRDELQGWRRVFTGPVTVVETPGSHATMMRPPNAAALAEKFRAVVLPAVGNVGRGKFQ